MFPRVNSSPISGSILSNDLSESLTKLATATYADRAMVATLTDTVSTLSAQIADTQANLVSSLLVNQKLLKLLSGSEQRTSGGAEGANNGVKNDPIHPDPNHIKNATKKYTMGGSQEIHKTK